MPRFTGSLRDGDCVTTYKTITARMKRLSWTSLHPVARSASKQSMSCGRQPSEVHRAWGYGESFIPHATDWRVDSVPIPRSLHKRGVIPKIELVEPNDAPPFGESHCPIILSLSALEFLKVMAIPARDMRLLQLSHLRLPFGMSINSPFGSKLGNRSLFR